MRTTTRSEALFQEIAAVIPGGIDGNAKVFPQARLPVAVSARGCRVTDADGNEYIDYCSGYGPLIFGHRDPDVLGAVQEQLAVGDLYGLPHVLMRDAAQLVVDSVPCAEMVRFTNSGTEATLNAIRLARAVTGRDKILKFYGTYHGTHEFVLIGTKVLDPAPAFPAAEANTAGIPAAVLQDIYMIPFNDLALAREFISAHAGELAGVIVEPVMGSYGIVAEQAWLAGLRELTEQYGILLIFDEVITGFRLALGGAQEVFGVIPDLVTLGKALGGGFPGIAAFAGRRRFMERVIPAGNPVEDARTRVYHSGTYNSNPIMLAAVKAALTKLTTRRSEVYPVINARGERLRAGLREMMARYGVKGTTTGMGSMVQWYFGIEGPVRSLQETLGADRAAMGRFHASLLEKGVFFIGQPRGFVSTAHTEADIDQTLEAMDAAFREMTGRA